MYRMYQIFFLIFFTSAVFGSNNSNRFLILEPLGTMHEPKNWPGFFACFHSVIGGLDFYEKNYYGGCRIEFKWGLYLDRQMGSDWWEYYFEPVTIGSPENMILIYLDNGQKHVLAHNAISSISRERACELIQRYVHIKPIVLDKINAFVRDNFKDNFVIGVHYRGTDKTSEAPRVPYSRVYLEVQKTIASRDSQTTPYIIFIATDEQDFIEYMTKKFGEKVCFLDAIRSSDGKPLHVHQAEPYRQGLETLMDCILLSKTNILIRTQSNVSAAAGNFNPQVPMITLNTNNASQWYPNIRKNLNKHVITD